MPPLPPPLANGALCLSTPKHNGKSGTVFSYSVVWCRIVPEPTGEITIGKLFSREKTLIYLVHNIPF